MKLELLFENFGLLADAPNGIPKLRELILQLAVIGRLEPQDPNDEPASILLEKIAAEKERLLAKGKIKKSKPLPPIDPDHLPYDLPEGWEWVRLGQLGQIQTGTTPSKAKPKYFGPGYSFVKPADISENEVKFGREELTKAGIAEGRLILAGSAMMVCIGGSIGKVGYVDRDCSCNQQINTLTPYAGIDGRFVAYCMKSPSFQQQVISQAPQTTLPILSKGKWELLLYPLQPLAEQKRILTKIDQLMELCDQLEDRKQKKNTTRMALNDASLDNLLGTESTVDFKKHWKRIVDNFDLLYDNPENVNKLRQAILQLAVQGKLVHQDPKDEPASILLEKIKTKKEQLIKEKRMRTQKRLPPINDFSQPFPVPKSWMWAYIQDITDLVTDGEHATPSRIDPPGIPLATAKNIRAGYIDLTNTDFVAKETAEKCWSRCKPQKNDILMVCVGATTGRLCIAAEVPDIVLVRSVALIRVMEPYILPEYASVCLRSPIGQEQIWGNVKQSAQPCLYIHKINAICLPIPPLEEQKHITKRANKLMALCDDLETKLSKSESDCDELLSAISTLAANKSGRTKKCTATRGRKLKHERFDPDKEPEPESQNLNVSSKKAPSESKPEKQDIKIEKRFGQGDVLKAFRKSIYWQSEIELLPLLREVGQRLNIRRLSLPIQNELESYLNTAIRRKILSKRKNGYRPATPTIHNYDEDFLIKAIRSVIKKGYEYRRDSLINKVAEYLGFDKVSDAFAEKMKSVFHKAIRRELLYRDGAFIGKL